MDASTLKTADISQDDNFSTKNVSKHCAPHAVNHLAKLALVSDEGISNSGITGHYILPSAPIKNLQATANFIIITVPDGKKSIYSHIKSGSLIVITPINQVMCLLESLKCLIPNIGQQTDDSTKEQYTDTDMWKNQNTNHFF